MTLNCDCMSQFVKRAWMVHVHNRLKMPNTLLNVQNSCLLRVQRCITENGAQFEQSVTMYFKDGDL